MSTSVTITGSGSPVPDGNRAGPGALVRFNEITLQFDVGRSTVQRLAGLDVWIPSLTAAFITHHHSDHLSGLADLVLTSWTMDRTDKELPLPIIAPAGPASNFVETLLVNWAGDIEVRQGHTGRSTRPGYDLISFPIPDVPTEVWRHQSANGGDVVASAMQVRHEPCPNSVGYRVDTPDGAVAITGDTVVCEEVAQLAEGVDVLVYEAMRFEFFEAMPEHRRFVVDYHADTRLIGVQARDLGVSTLILTHLLPAPNNDAEQQAYVDDIRAGGFEGELIVAHDLDTAVVGAGDMPEVRRVVHSAEQD